MKTKFKKNNVLSIAAAHLLHDTYSSFFAPLLPLLIEKLGFTYTIAGALSVINRIPTLLNPVIGLIADRVVIRSAIIIAPIITIIAMSLLGSAPSTILLGVLLFVSGISAAVFHVTAPVLMRQVSGNQIGKGMSFFMFGGEMARTLGPLLITAAISWGRLEGTWRLIPIGLAASLFLFFNLRTIDKKHIRTFHTPNTVPLHITLRKITPFFTMVGPILIFRGFSKTALTLFLPSYMVANGSSVKTGAIALAFLELAGAAGALLSGSLSDRIGRKPVLLFIMFLSPALMFLFTLASGILQWIILGFIGLLFFASTPVFMAMIHDLQTDRPSFTNGLYMTVSFLAGSLVAFVIGILADRFTFITTYQISAVLSLFAIPFTFLLENKNAGLSH